MPSQVFDSVNGISAYGAASVPGGYDASSDPTAFSVGVGSDPMANAGVLDWVNSDNSAAMVGDSMAAGSAAVNKVTGAVQAATTLGSPQNLILIGVVLIVVWKVL